MRQIEPLLKGGGLFVVMRLSNLRRTLAHVPGRAFESRNNASRRNVPATGANVAATWQRKKRPEGRFEIRSAFGAVDGNDHLAADSLESNVDPGVTRCEHSSEGVGPQFLKPGAVFVSEFATQEEACDELNKRVMSLSKEKS